MKNTKDTPAPPRHGEAATHERNGGHRLDSSALFGVRSEITIVHNAEEYRLRITRAGKLILTK